VGTPYNPKGKANIKNTQVYLQTVAELTITAVTALRNYCNKINNECVPGSKVW
jgi:hypothetical protein